MDSQSSFPVMAYRPCRRHDKIPPAARRLKKSPGPPLELELPPISGKEK